MGELLDRDLSEEEIVAEVNADYAEKYGFADVEDYTFKAEKGLNEEKILLRSNRDLIIHPFYASSAVPCFSRIQS